MAWTTAVVPPENGAPPGRAAAPRTRSGCARRDLADPRGQSASATPVLKFQLPRYEHVLTRDDAALVGQFLRDWGGPRWVDGPDFADYERKCRDAMQIPQAAFCALEAYRWAFRSVLRLHGYRFVKLLQQPIVTPTLQLHGALDRAVLPRTAQGSGRYVTARYEWRLLDDVGHFPHVEVPDLVIRRDPASGSKACSSRRGIRAGR